MKTPQEKFNSDPEYRSLVSMLESFIHSCRFTPSEVREAATYACIRYELNNISHHIIYSDVLHQTCDAIETKKY